MYCSCTIPVTYLCDSCFIPHRNKNPSLVHCTATVEVPNFPQYLQRCQVFVQGKEELLGNIARIDLCCTEITNAVETLIVQIQQYKDEFLKQLQAMKGEMTREINQSIEEAEASIGQDTVELKGKYSAALRHYVPNSLTIFTYQIDCTQVYASLQSLIQIQFSPSPQPSSLSAAIPPAQVQTAEIYWVTGKSVQCFDVRTSQLHPPVQLRTPILADENSRWAVVDSGRVVLCGGGKGDTSESLVISGYSKPRKTAYLLSKTGEVETLPELQYGHQSPGVIAWNGRVLVFGSSRGPGGRQCEALVLTGQTWEAFAEMHKKRFEFTPAIWRDSVYLCGGARNRTVEVFDGVSLQLLEFRFPEGIQCMACAHGETLLVVTVNYLIVLSRTGSGSEPDSVLKARRGAGSQTFTPPVVWNEVIYSFDEDGDVCKYSAETGASLD